MTDGRPNTPGEQSEPVMDGAMDHEGPPTTTDSAGRDVDLTSAPGSKDHTVDAEHPDELDVADETVLGEEPKG